MDISLRYTHYHVIKRRCYSDALGDTGWTGLLPHGLILDVLNKECIEIAHQWHAQVAEPINWLGVLSSRNNKQPRHFDVGLFLDNRLVGLAFGRVSKGKRFVRIDYMQRCHTADQLKSIFTPLVIDVAARYGAELGAKCVKITNPNSYLREQLLEFVDGAQFKHADPVFPRDHVHIAIS